MTVRNLEPYFDWAGLDGFAYPLDPQGIPLARFNRKIGWQHNPITIAQYGLYRLHKWADGGADEDRAAALRCGLWLKQNLAPWREGQFAWIYRYDLSFYGPRAPWISAMAQGEGISLLLRLAKMQPEQEWTAAACQAFTPFLHTVEHGGVVDRLDSGDVIFEEYPTQPPSHVLNGFIFALFGVFDLARHTEDQSAQALCRQAVKTLQHNWQRWDTGFWTRYDLHPTGRLASPMYHELHIRLLQQTAERFNAADLSAVAARWRAMQKKPGCWMRMGGGKAFEKIRLLGRRQ
ncbi:MAG TPA: D-glucuronyl C5-epimerase family protein [bacterium]|nr:D-glucuronyl C5-epimerase family protein [bacterium]